MRNREGLGEWDLGVPGVRGQGKGYLWWVIAWLLKAGDRPIISIKGIRIRVYVDSERWVWIGIWIAALQYVLKQQVLYEYEYRNVVNLSSKKQYIDYAPLNKLHCSFTIN